MRKFLRLKAAQFDESFQLQEDFSVDAMKIAQNKRAYFLFKTLGGRKCAVNFATIDAMLLSDWAEIHSSTYQLPGVRMYFLNQSQHLEVHATKDEISTFFLELESKHNTAQLGDWTIDKENLVVAIAH